MRRDKILAILLILIVVGYFIVHLFVRFLDGFAWDFAINWTATIGLKNGLSLYDRDGLRMLGQSMIGPVMAYTFSETFNSYIGLPSTAVFLLPFSFWTFSESLIIYRLFSLLAFVMAVLIAGLSIPPHSRKLGWLLGLSGLFMSDAVMTSLQLGQVDAWIVLALAVSLWLAGNDRWGTAGIGIGIATLLKISPGLLIIYCVLRGKIVTAFTASLTICIGLIIAMLIGNPNDLGRFYHDVMPLLSMSSLHIQNQSVAAWLARIFLPDSDLLLFSRPIDGFQVFGGAVALIIMFILWRRLHRQPTSSLEFGLIIVALLLAGPITWDHYTSWVIIVIVYMANYELWYTWENKERANLLVILVMGMILLSIPTIYFPPSAIEVQWGLRLATGIKTLGLIIVLGVGMALVQRRCRLSQSASAQDLYSARS